MQLGGMQLGRFAVAPCRSDLPEWPVRSTLSMDHRSLLASAMASLKAVYSDWHFSSAWAWDVDGSASLARVGDLLVLGLPRYDGRGQRFSVLGSDPRGSSETPVSV